MCHGSGGLCQVTVQFDFVFFVGSDVSWLRSVGTGQVSQVLQRLQKLETVAVEQLDRASVWQRGGMDQLKDRDERLLWDRQSAAAGRREDQYGRGEPRANGHVQLYFVGIMLCTGRDWHGSAGGSTRLELRRRGRLHFQA